jgi:FtsZ-interacting cell division protein ZipA
LQTIDEEKHKHKVNCEKNIEEENKKKMRTKNKKIIIMKVSARRVYLTAAPIRSA